MPKSRQPWDSVRINAQLDRVLSSLRRELWEAAKRPPNLSQAYIEDLIARATWNKKWTAGMTLKCSWRNETI